MRAIMFVAVAASAVYLCLATAAGYRAELRYGGPGYARAVAMTWSWRGERSSNPARAN